LDVQGDAEHDMATKPGFDLISQTITAKSSAVLNVEEIEQQPKEAEGQAWEEDEQLDVDLEAMAERNETDAEHEGQVVHGNEEKEPEKKVQGSHNLLPANPTTKELEVVPEHGWEGEDVLDLDDLDVPVPSVDAAETVQKVQDSS
jgi:hypothetical protein